MHLSKMHPYQWKNLIKINIFFGKKSHVYMCWALKRLSSLTRVGTFWIIMFLGLQRKLHPRTDFVKKKANKYFENRIHGSRDIAIWKRKGCLNTYKECQQKMQKVSMKYKNIYQEDPQIVDIIIICSAFSPEVWTSIRRGLRISGGTIIFSIM